MRKHNVLRPIGPIAAVVAVGLGAGACTGGINNPFHHESAASQKIHNEAKDIGSRALEAIAANMLQPNVQLTVNERMGNDLTEVSLTPVRVLSSPTAKSYGRGTLVEAQINIRHRPTLDALRAGKVSPTDIELVSWDTRDCQNTDCHLTSSTVLLDQDGGWRKDPPIGANVPIASARVWGELLQK